MGGKHCKLEMSGFSKVNFVLIYKVKSLASFNPFCARLKITSASLPNPPRVILGQTNLITNFSGFQISKPMQEAAFYFIF